MSHQFRGEGLPIWYKHNVFRVVVTDSGFSQPQHSLWIYGLQQSDLHMTIVLERLLPWEQVMAVLRSFWAGEIDDVENLLWTSEDRRCWRTERRHAGICSDAVSLVRSGFQKPWREVEEWLWSYARDRDWTGIVGDLKVRRKKGRAQAGSILLL